MPKEACRLLTLTFSLFGIICMAKGLSTIKESAINKNIYYNKFLNSREEFDCDNKLDYENEYFRQKKYAVKDESGNNLKNVNEKSGNIPPINNGNQLHSETAIKNQFIENNRENLAYNNKYDLKIIKKRQNNLGGSRPGRKNPLSYLHINHDRKYKQPEMFIINANNFNEDVIQRLTRAEKKYELPMCDINENQENIPSLRKRGLSNSNQIPISKIDLNPELKRKVRAQWKFRDHYNNFDMKFNNYKSPVGNNKIENSDKSKQIDTSYDTSSKNLMIKRGTLDEAQVSSILASKPQEIPSKKEKTREKKNESYNSVGNTLIVTNIKSGSKDSIISKKMNSNNNLSSLVNNTLDQIGMVRNQELSDLTQINLTNQSMISANKEKTENINPTLKEKTEYSENGPDIQSNLTNYFEHSEKNKIQMPNIQSPSMAPLTLAHGVLPNISYVYVQPLPFGNSMFLNQPKPVESSTASIKKSDPVANPENKSNDLITISIDPKTLQNKILHAEFMKKSDVRKTPDTLSIELSPKDTTSTNPKHQKTVQKPLKISASVKNNSILITGGDKIGYHTYTANEKQNQQYQSFEENLGESEMEKESLNRQSKSISSSININDIVDENKSLHGYNSQNVSEGKTDETKVLIISAKQKEVCATEEPCKQLSTYCSIDLCESDTHCKRSTWNLQNFHEVHEGGLKEEKEKCTSLSTKGSSEDKTVSASVSDESMIAATESVQYGVKIKREADQMNISKIINLLKPVLVLGPKVDNEGSEDESADSTGIIDKVNLKGSSEMAFEKGNKKVENKILEGFINSIIANYSKDEIKPLMKETTEKSEDGAEALLKLLENSMPKRNERDKEFSDDKKSDLWSLTPILVPESSISKYGDSTEYAKLGPFDENFIKSFLKKDYISSLYRKKK